MTLFARVKIWLVIAGGVCVAVLTLLLSVFNKGRAVERAKGIEEAAEAQEKHNDRVTKAVEAGDAARIDAAKPDRLRVDDGHKRRSKTQ